MGTEHVNITARWKRVNGIYM